MVGLEHLLVKLAWAAAEVCRDADVAHRDLLVRLHGVLGPEGRRSGRHLVQRHPKRPVVHGPVVALAEDDLRGQVVGSAAERPGPAARELLGQAEVHDLEVPPGVQHEVLRLEVVAGDLA